MRLILVCLLLCVIACKHEDDKTITVINPDMVCHKEWHDNGRILFVCEGREIGCSFYNGTMSISCTATVKKK